MFPFDDPPAPLWKDLLAAVPGILGGLAAIGGVLVARAGLSTWRRETIGKRRAELAEAVLADFYEAHDIIAVARSPGGFEGEGKTRQREIRETEDVSRSLDSYFRTVERLNNKAEFFAGLHARRYRFRALFGTEAAAPFEDLFRIRGEIIIDARMLIMNHTAGDIGTLPQIRPAWLATIGWDPTNDQITPRLDQLVQAMETVCRPAIVDREGGS